MRAILATLLLFFLAVPVLIFYAITVVGCATSLGGLQNIFLATIRNTTSGDFEVRVSYFGICASYQDKVECLATTYGTPPEAVRTTLSPALVALGGFDPLPLLSIAVNLQKSVFLCLGLFPAVLFAAGIVLLHLKIYYFKHEKEDLRFRTWIWRSPFNNRIAEGLILVSTIVSLVSAVSATQIANVLGFALSIEKHTVAIQGGRTIQILQWFAFASSLAYYAVVRFWVNRYYLYFPPPPSL